MRARAIQFIRQLDEGAGYQEMIERELKVRLARTPAPAVAAPATGVCTCGTANDVDALFCKKCGTKLGAV